MGRQNHGRASLAVDPGDELANRLFGDHVEPDRRLVEKDELGIVQHRGREIAPHPFAQRQLADRRAHEPFEIEEPGELGQVFPVAVPRNVVDRAQQLERLAQRQIPVQLAALSEHDADVLGVGLTLLVRNEAGDADSPGCGHENTGQHLDRRRLAGAVGADIADDFARLKTKADALDGRLLLVFAREERAKRPAQPGLAFDRPEDLPKVDGLDDRHRPSASSAARAGPGTG